ncbi:MAG TPA: Hsp20/alpha crystallin family protein [Sulfurovum sp.]|nr:MAG: heat-shock protein Hsp20 [Sulfurovum sp. 35-42-20]OYZ26669.1 MAG: heat-shock protein Hsp20 [Sulfurovum sp. 16-42-52]OYZ49343.1 MAG: heat-shock protein Hsp20 [Sulfurovum sp. 24-42-9]OZA47047.1 MAG: heat-shock protein Hsp20 [Sulfurovum sp. 17-42-90]OZA60114.1 MAG: heat-shock protein Hsp20 [Sulfurovum sp. 39-42-12]HQR73412.1 Hsp20/alpha crystallin family protein [Sulfurovum sp.]
MDIIEKTKEIGNEIEESLEKGYEKGKEILSNVASHLPFANLAKKKSGDFHVEIDMPGVKKEDIEVRIDNNILTVSGERKMKKEVKKKDYYLMESSFGRIERSFSLPKGIDQDKISAQYKDGRLVIDLEKEESSKPKAIEVK